MAITYQTPGTLAYGVGNCSAALPASIAAGDYLVLVIGSKPDTVTPGFPEGVGIGWRLLGYKSGGGGTTGVDAGPTNITMFGRVADGLESGNVVSQLAGNSVSWWQIYRFSGATGWWNVACDGGEDATTGTAWSATIGSDIGITGGDLLLAASCIPTDVTTPAQFSAEAISATGLTMGTMTEREEPDSASGNDIGGFVFTQEVTSGTSSAAAVVTATAGGTTTNVRGPTLLLRLREADPPAVTCVADGGVTFLTAATNKTTASFTVAVDDVIIIAVAADEPACTFGTITNTGTAFTWTLTQSRQTGGAAVPPTYVWTTTATAAQSMTVNVVQTAGPTDAFWGIAVQVFRGGTLGTSALAFGTASAPSGAMTCSANSAVSVFLADENGTIYTAPDSINTVGGMGQTTHYENDPAWLNSMFWYHPDVGASGSKTFGHSQGAQDWNLVTVEIIPATGNITASPSAIASLEAFGTAVITKTLTVSPGGIASLEAFGTPVVSTPLTVSPSGVATLEALGTPTITLGPITVSPGGVATLEAFGTVTVSNILTLTPTAISSAETFGTPVVSGVLTVSPSGIASSETFGTPVVSGALTVSPGAIASAEAFGAVTISTIYTVSPDGIATAEAVGTPAVSIQIPVAPGGIASAEAFGTVTVSAVSSAQPDAIASLEAFGTPVISGALTVSPGGIASAEALGSPTITATLTVSPAGIASAETFGSPVVSGALTVSPGGIATQEAFGTPSVGSAYVVAPAGIASAESFGTVTVSNLLTVVVSGIASAESFGTPEHTGLLEVYPTGVSSTSAVGTPDVSQILLVSPGGIATGELVGTPEVGLVLLVVVGGIGTAESFGTLEVTLGAKHSTITTTMPARGRYATGTPSGDRATATPSGDTTNLGTKNRSGTNTPRNRGAQ